MLLAVDTALSACSIAIGDGIAAPLAIRQQLLRHGHAEALMGLIANALDEAGCGYEDLTGLVASRGPGAFTGLRVGLAALQGIALGRDIPLLGLTTTEVIARKARARHPDTPLIVAIDSRRAEPFVQPFGRDGRPMGEIIGLNPRKAEDWLASLPETPVHVAGDAPGKLPMLIPIADCEQPDPAIMLALGAETLKGKRPHQPATPVYIRPPDAARAKDQRRLADD